MAGRAREDEALEPSGEPLAAVDLGSNSFHMVIGRELGGELGVLDRLRDPVRLAAGLDEEGRLSEETVEHMLASLRRFRQRLADVPADRQRALGTYTFRQAREPADLLARAGEALGHEIEILSGPEEARLIYLGVAQAQPTIEGRRLVVDIGGGSTECILGDGFQPLFMDSLQMGCVAYTGRYFRDGRLSKKSFEAATIAARLELGSIARRFRSAGWEECVGSSGTIRAVVQVLRELEGEDVPITLERLRDLRKRIIDHDSVDDLELPGLQADRAPVFAGGVAILEAVFESLRIETMSASRAALREGVLYDLLGRIRHEDVRDRTIRALSKRYHVEEDQARRVEQTALAALEQVAEAWELRRPEYAQLLSWAARTHELGLAIAYSGHHHHGAYLLRHSAMPGFSRGEQERLAALVSEHRRKLSRSAFDVFPRDEREAALRLAVLLRLAVRLNRTRSSRAVPPFRIAAKKDELELALDADWLAAHPLTRADLEDEDRILRPAGFGLRLAGGGTVSDAPHPRGQC